MVAMLDKAKVLANYTQSLATGVDWGVDDQYILEWLIAQADKVEKSTELMQRVWDDHSGLVSEISEALDGADMSTDEMYLISGAIGDNKSSKKLRDGLFEAGVKNIAGKVYT